VNIEGVEKALKLIKDRPVFAGCIGPFSLAGRLMDVNEAMVNCYDEPEMVHVLFRKSNRIFVLIILKSNKKIGAHGIIMAEPLAGILSPGLMQEFSTEYVKKIVDEVQDENFM
jgi:uroporphyrinogen decarboxylase